MVKKRRRLREPARDEKRVGAPIPAHLRPRPALDYELGAKPDHPLRSALRNLTPGLNYLTRSYHRRWLRRDGIAGVAVAAYLIPQVMAYSALIGVPPVPANRISSTRTPPAVRTKCARSPPASMSKAPTTSSSGRAATPDEIGRFILPPSVSELRRPALRSKPKTAAPRCPDR